MVPSVDVSSIADLLPAGHVPTETMPRSGGQLSTIREVRFVNAEPLIVKQYAARWHWKQAKELHVYRLLAANRFGPVPQVVNVDHGRAITVLTRLPGQTMSEGVLTTHAQQAAYHGIGELWDWFASTGNTEPLPNIADDIHALAIEVRSGIAEPANRPYRNLET
jgi:hygromycin-B 7''-O-kinase